jgi:renalase
MLRRVAVIGAGIAGLAAAQRLKRSGAVVTLFEKSREVGGRMATRRIDDLQFDHGAQYFTATGDGFDALVEQWRTAGHVTEWFDGAFVGTPRITAPARAPKVTGTGRGNTFVTPLVTNASAVTTPTSA